MNDITHARVRLSQMLELAIKELNNLNQTDSRLFAKPFTAASANELPNNPELGERVEAFVARFGRLQDALGNKLIPTYLAASGETPATFIENLDRAERLGLVADAQKWIDIRQLRNQMGHEYGSDPTTLASALNAAHGFIPNLAEVAQSLREHTGL